MAQIQGFRIRNYKALKDIKIGCLQNDWKDRSMEPLTPLTVIIGKNGVGKSSILEAFGFIADSLKNGVEEACEHRGGFSKILSKGVSKKDAIEFEIYYRENDKDCPITYEFSVALDAGKRPYVQKERLRQRRDGQKKGQPFSFLILNKGVGVVWKGNAEGKEIQEEKELFDVGKFINKIEKQSKRTKETNETEIIKLDDTRHLGIATLGSLKQHPRITTFRKFIESWYLSYFTPDAARSLPATGAQKKLSTHGDNLANVVQFMEREHPKDFKNILDRIAKKIPGLEKIDTIETADGRLLLRFFNTGLKDEPLYAQQMSDGTLKVFTYMLLMEDPSPSSFICIEEPENGIYHKLLETLATEFRDHAESSKNKFQVFVTTHQPYFVNALDPKEVWILEKQKDGFSTLKRASEIPAVKELVEEGLPLGGLWYSNYLD